MSYTATDLSEIQRAITELQAGRTTASVIIAGVATDYDAEALPALIALRDTALADQVDFSSADLGQIKTAIIALSTGQRVASVTIGGKTIQYQPADLKALCALRDQIKAENTATTVNRCYRIKTSSGF